MTRRGDGVRKGAKLDHVIDVLLRRRAINAQDAAAPEMESVKEKETGKMTLEMEQLSRRCERECVRM